METIEIPQLMSRLPVDDRGYPVPYFVPWVNGKPDFRYQDPKKKIACRKFSKCSICGQHLEAKTFWFICGPLGLLNSVASDEPMHETCARFSIRYCPHLVFYKAERRSDPTFAAPSQVHPLARNKPTKIYLVKADKLWHIDAVNTRFRTVEVLPYKYENNKLVPA